MRRKPCSGTEKSVHFLPKLSDNEGEVSENRRTV